MRQKESSWIQALLSTGPLCYSKFGVLSPCGLLVPLCLSLSLFLSHFHLRLCFCFIHPSVLHHGGSVTVSLSRIFLLSVPLSLLVSLYLQSVCASALIYFSVSLSVCLYPQRPSNPRMLGRSGFSETRVGTATREVEVAKDTSIPAVVMVTVRAGQEGARRNHVGLTFLWVSGLSGSWGKTATASLWPSPRAHGLR